MIPAVVVVVVGVVVAVVVVGGVVGFVGKKELLRLCVVTEISRRKIL